MSQGMFFPILFTSRLTGRFLATRLTSRRLARQAHFWTLESSRKQTITLFSVD